MALATDADMKRYHAIAHLLSSVLPSSQLLPTVGLSRAFGVGIAGQHSGVAAAKSFCIEVE